MRFDDDLRRDLFDYYPETFAAQLALPTLPMGVEARPDAVSFAALLEMSAPLRIDEVPTGHEAGIVAVQGVERGNVARLAGLPNLQRVAWGDRKSSVLPRELTGLPGLRILELNLTARLKTLHKNLAQAARLEGLVTINLHNLRDITLLSALPALRYVALGNTVKLTDYAPLKQLPLLRHLKLEALNLEDAAPTVAELTGLEVLDLKSCLSFQRALDAGLALLRSRPELKGLGLGGANLRMASLPPLEALEQLDLYGASGVSEDLFAASPALRSASLQFYEGAALPRSLGALGHLTALDLSFARSLDGDGFAPLGSLTGLTHLSLAQARGLRRLPRELAALTGLQQLDLGGLHLEDLSVLHGLPALRILNIEAVADPQVAIDAILSLPALERVQVHPGVDVMALADHPALRFVMGNKRPHEAIAARFDARHSAAWLRR